MNRAVSVVPASEVKAEPIDIVRLDFAGRHRRRVAMRGEWGTDFLLDLPEAAALRDGDGLVLDDGRIVLVRSLPEQLAEIGATTPADLIRLAWHLGNRHLPTQLLGDRLRIRRDHVIEEMVRRLGGIVTSVDAPFDPEGGAYGVGEVHGHSHGDRHHGHHHHGHAHRGAHSRDHKHGHDD